MAYLTLKEAAAQAGVPEHVVRAWISKGLLDAEKVSGRWNIRPTDLSQAIGKAKEAAATTGITGAPGSSQGSAPAGLAGTDPRPSDDVTSAGASAEGQQTLAERWQTAMEAWWPVAVVVAIGLVTIIVLVSDGGSSSDDGSQEVATSPDSSSAQDSPASSTGATSLEDAIAERCPAWLSDDQPSLALDRGLLDLSDEFDQSYIDVLDVAVDVCDGIGSAVEAADERLAAAIPEPDANGGRNAADEALCEEWFDWALYETEDLNDAQYAEALATEFLPRAQTDRFRAAFQQEIDVYRNGYTGERSALNDLC